MIMNNECNNHFADVGKMVESIFNYGDFATSKPVEFDGGGWVWLGPV
jgi:hypothetical protein